jgi:virginiamycin B lyase
MWTNATACSGATASCRAGVCVNPFTEYTSPDLTGPFEITIGPPGDANLYLTDVGATGLFRLSPQNGNISRVATTGGSIPDVTQSIGLGPDNNVWVTEGGTSIDRVTSTGALTRFATAHPIGGQTIRSGPDGNVWFSEFGSGFIGRVSLPAGTVQEFPVPVGMNPFGLAFALDGTLWATLSGSDQVIQLTPSGNGLILGKQVALPKGSAPGWLVQGPGGDLWFAEYGGNKIAYVTSTGNLVEPVALSGKVGPDSVTYDQARGLIWFVEFDASRIGRLTLSGATVTAVDEFPTPTPNAGPLFITIGRDGSIWFTEQLAKKIGHFVP